METRVIAVPVLDGLLSKNYADADKIFIYTVENEEIIKEQMEVVEKNSIETAIVTLADAGVTEILGAEMKESEIETFLSNGIGVILSAPVMQPKDLVLDYMEQMDDHGHGGCCGGGGHHHDHGHDHDGGGCGCSH